MIIAVRQHAGIHCGSDAAAIAVEDALAHRERTLDDNTSLLFSQKIMFYAV
jgi:hypothetical protein